MNNPIRVLILCTGNSARSQMAEGLLRHFGGQDFEVYSAGTQPQGINPLAIKVMAEYGIDISEQRSQHVDEFLDEDFDFLITVCDNARDNCPIFPKPVTQIHWSNPDPAAQEGDEEIRLQAFRAVAEGLRGRICAWIETQR